jgi:phage shock protein A
MTTKEAIEFAIQAMEAEQEANLASELAGRSKQLDEAIEVLRKALKEGKVIPTELRKEEQELRREIELEDEYTKNVRDHVVRLFFEKINDDGI